MPGMPMADISKLTGRTQELLTMSQQGGGIVPNVLKQMANSPAALEAFMAAREALCRGALDPKVGALIAITIAETYSCEYMLAARVAMAKKMGLTDEEIRLGKEQRSNDPKVDAGLSFVRNLVLRHGEVTPEDMNELKAANYTDGEVVELIANASINMFAYYMIKVAQPEADYAAVATAFPA